MLTSSLLCDTHAHTLSRSVFPINSPLNDLLLNAFERNSPFFPLSHSFHTASIDNIFSFFPISYFQMTKTQLRISRRNLIEKQHNCSSIISIINIDPLINLYTTWYLLIIFLYASIYLASCYCSFYPGCRKTGIPCLHWFQRQALQGHLWRAILLPWWEKKYFPCRIGPLSKSYPRFVFLVSC